MRSGNFIYEGDLVYPCFPHFKWEIGLVTWSDGKYVRLWVVYSNGRSSTFPESFGFETAIPASHVWRIPETGSR